MSELVQGKKPNRTLKKVVLWLIGFLIVVAVVVLMVTPPLVMSDMINQHVDFNTVYHAEDFDLEATPLMLRTADEHNISAFEVAVDNPQAVVIFISGIHGPSVTAFYGHASWLKDYEYASILYDMRAHGNSDGDLIGLGYLETKDTQAVVDYIKTQPHYNDLPIIVYGVSMGGATAINSLGQIPELAGGVSLSAYSSWVDVFYDSMLAMGVPQIWNTLQRPFVKLYACYKYGFSTANIVPSIQIACLGDRPLLLMHSTEDSQVPYASFERLAEQAPEHVETWVRSGDLHFVTTDFLHPESDLEYATVVLDFLAEVTR